LNAWIGTPKPSLSVEAHRKFRQPYASVLDHIIQKFPNVVIFDPGSCIYLDDHICYLSPDGILLYRDEHHWTKGAAFKISNRILELLKQ
jgi:hypothetical protein